MNNRQRGATRKRWEARKADRERQRKYEEFVLEVFHPIDSIQSGDRVAVCARVSHRKDKLHLGPQINGVVQAVEQRGGIVEFVGPPHVGDRNDPTWLMGVVQEAGKHGVTKLVGESITRYIRPPNSPDYWGRNSVPRLIDLRHLSVCTWGLTLVTVVDPFEEDRPFQTRRQKDQVQTCRILKNVGWSLREIGKLIGKSHMTPKRWLEEVGLGV